MQQNRHRLEESGYYNKENRLKQKFCFNLNFSTEARLYAYFT